MGQELILEFRHVDVGWAFGLATLAFQAKIERVMQRLACEFVSRDFSGNDLAQVVSAAARGVNVFQGDHVRRTHRSFILFPAAFALFVACAGVGVVMPIVSYAPP